MNRLLFFACLATVLQACVSMPATPAATGIDRALDSDLVGVAARDLEQDARMPAATATIVPRHCAVVTAARSLHMRAAPGREASVVKYLYFGDQVEVLANGEAWWKIEKDQIVGYANARYLQEGGCGE